VSPPDRPPGAHRALAPEARRVLDVVDRIPRGRVMSYGDVGAAAGVASARLVGQVMARWGHEVPWHRVVRADGTVASHLAATQIPLLRAEGVPLRPGTGRVDMRRARAGARRPEVAPDRPRL